MHTHLATRAPIAILTSGALLLALVWGYGAWQHRDAVGRRVALIGAVKAADVARVRRLLREGAEVGSERPGGESAVHAALQPARADPRSRAIAELLVEKMVSDGVPRYGASLRFALAVEASRSDLLRELLTRAPDSDLTDAAMNTALELAIVDDQPQMVSALVDRVGHARAGRLCAPDGPVLYACSSGSTETLRLLLDRFGPWAIQGRARDPKRHGATCLLLALQDRPQRALPKLRLLLDRGAEPNVADHAGVTPLMLAVERNRSDRVRLLLAHGADPRLRDRSGRGPEDRLSGKRPGMAAELRRALSSAGPSDNARPDHRQHRP